MESLIRLRRIDGIVSTVQRCIRWSSLVGIAAFLYLSARMLSGQHTFADIGLKVIGNFKIGEALSYLFGAAGVGYGLRERRLRWAERKFHRETIEGLKARNSMLEALVDSNRTSIPLTARRRTNPEDRT